jgi:hypothetical protein
MTINVFGYFFLFYIVCRVLEYGLVKLFYKIINNE